jgi:hypothetical protein
MHGFALASRGTVRLGWPRRPRFQTSSGPHRCGKGELAAMGSSTEGIWIVLLVVAGLFVLLFVVGLALILLWWAFLGGRLILAFAVEQGFLGLAAYVACWVLLFPVMLTISIVVGFLVARASSEARKEDSSAGGLLASLRKRKEERMRARQRKTRRQLGYED